MIDERNYGIEVVHPKEEEEATRVFREVKGIDDYTMENTIIGSIGVFAIGLKAMKELNLLAEARGDTTMYTLSSMGMAAFVTLPLFVSLGFADGTIKVKDKKLVLTKFKKDIK